MLKCGKRKMSQILGRKYKLISKNQPKILKKDIPFQHNCIIFAPENCPVV